MTSQDSNPTKIKFSLSYCPSRHLGLANWRNEVFDYEITMDGSVFHNQDEANPVGFNAHDEEGNYMRFRYDRIITMKEAA